MHKLPIILMMKKDLWLWNHVPDVMTKKEELVEELQHILKSSNSPMLITKFIGSLLRKMIFLLMLMALSQN